MKRSGLKKTEIMDICMNLVLLKLVGELIKKALDLVVLCCQLKHGK